LFVMMMMVVGGWCEAEPRDLGLTPFVYPVMTPQISSSYGMRKHPLLKFSHKHQGTDLAADLGAPIRSVAPGRVVFADPYARYGNLVVIEHARGVTTHYGHCDKIKIKPGQSVNAGDIIATIGSTGLSSGPHLHFEIRVNGEALDPETIIPDLAKHPDG
jgi:murein DD-endopeptidase MepM/ murein hydrolase activator NlpD